MEGQFTTERQMTSAEAAEAILDLFRGKPVVKFAHVMTARPLSETAGEAIRDAESATEAQAALAAKGITFSRMEGEA